MLNIDASDDPQRWHLEKLPKAMKHMKKKKDNEHDFYLVLTVTFYLG